jgi:hypothetical protein
MIAIDDRMPNRKNLLYFGIIGSFSSGSSISIIA